MTIVVEIRDDELRRRISRGPELAGDFLDSVADAIVSEWKQSMQQTAKRSQPVKRKGSGSHRPSLPGHPPAIDLGNLINSLHHETSGNDREFRGADYGLYLDQEKDRPFIESGLEAVRDNDVENIARAIWGE